MHEPICNFHMDRRCPRCNCGSTNLRNAQEAEDPDFFYSSCPTCNSMNVSIYNCVGVLVSIASELRIVCLHYAQCTEEKCSQKEWITRIRATFYCSECDLEWDVQAVPIPVYHIEHATHICKKLLLEDIRPFSLIRFVASKG